MEPFRGDGTFGRDGYPLEVIGTLTGFTVQFLDLKCYLFHTILKRDGSHGLQYNLQVKWNHPIENTQGMCNEFSICIGLKIVMSISSHQ